MLYLVKQNKIYHLRIKVPPDLIRIIGRREMRLTLKDSQKRSATKKVNSIKCKVRDLFERIMVRELEVNSMLAKGELTKEEINKIVRAYIHQLLYDFDREQAFGKHRNSDTIDRELEALDVGIVESKINFAERRHKESESFHMDLLLDELGISLDKNSESYQVLCY